MNFSSVRNYCFSYAFILLLLPAGCDEDNHHSKQTKTYSCDVVTRWLDVQTTMLYVQSGNPFGFNPSRYMAYFGVAVYESVLPGMPDYQTLHGQLTDMPQMPVKQADVSYHWPASANAAMAAMTRKFFSGIRSVYNEQAITSLENELSGQYRNEVDEDTFLRSVEFGKEVADKIFAWSETDKAAWPTVAYQLPSYYPGLWQPEAGAPVNPYWGYNRLMVAGSLDNTVSPPLPYSTDPSSPYYKEMQEVYTVSQSLTHEQKRIAKYFNDANPGFPAASHYISVLKQVLQQLKPTLDKAALTYAKTGITLLDASIGSFKTKYDPLYLKERPFSFIRSQIAPVPNPPTGQWTPFLSTPGFPDFPSNHAVFSSSVAYAFSSIYGNQVAFTDASYEGIMANLGNGDENLGTRHYNSFDEMCQEISMSRLYGGIHYRYSCEEGMKQGKKIAQNIDNKLKFGK